MAGVAPPRAAVDPGDELTEEEADQHRDEHDGIERRRLHVGEGPQLDVDPLRIGDREEDEQERDRQGDEPIDEAAYEKLRLSG